MTRKVNFFKWTLSFSIGNRESKNHKKAQSTQKRLFSDKETVDQLNESDFREIRQLIISSTGDDYSTWTIRKVCKGDRNNDLILETAKDYIKTLSSLKNLLTEVEK